MALITTAEQRMSQSSGVKLVIVGPPKVGKTSLLWTLDPDSTLALDMEAGMLSVRGWPGDSIDVRQRAADLGLHPHIFLKHMACLLSGPNPAVTKDDDFFSRAHHSAVVRMLGEREAVFGKYKHIFGDSITQMGRYAFSWAQTQPEAFSEKTGKPDTRGAYGLLGREMVGASGLLSHLQHCQDKDIILVGILEQAEDDYKRKTWRMQIDGGKTANGLPGIVDQVISMVELDFEGGVKSRAFVCQRMNQWGYPAGDRSGKLDVLEEPHLGRLLEKIKGGKRAVEPDQYTYAMPGAVASDDPAPWQETPAQQQTAAEQPVAQQQSTATQWGAAAGADQHAHPLAAAVQSAFPDAQQKQQPDGEQPIPY